MRLGGTHIIKLFSPAKRIYRQHKKDWKMQLMQ